MFARNLLDKFRSYALNGISARARCEYKGLYLMGVLHSGAVWDLLFTTVLQALCSEDCSACMSSAKLVYFGSLRSIVCTQFGSNCLLIWALPIFVGRNLSDRTSA